MRPETSLSNMCPGDADADADGLESTLWEPLAWDNL